MSTIYQIRFASLPSWNIKRSESSWEDRSKLLVFFCVILIDSHEMCWWQKDNLMPWKLMLIKEKSAIPDHITPAILFIGQSVLKCNTDLRPKYLTFYLLSLSWMLVHRKTKNRLYIGLLSAQGKRKWLKNWHLYRNHLHILSKVFCYIYR